MTLRTSAAVKFKPKREPPRPPAHLSADIAGWWQRVQLDFDLDEHHVRLLTAAAECWDRANEARGELAVAGVVVTDRFGQVKAHPAVAIERDMKALFARLLREIGLDVQEPSTPRPAALD